MSQTIELADGDAALVARADGTIEAILPDQDDEEPASDATIIILHGALVASDNNLKQVVHKALLKQINSTKGEDVGTDRSKQN